MREYLPTAYFKVLKLNPAAVIKPESSYFHNSRASTVTKEDTTYIPVQNNFIKKFKHPHITIIIEDLIQILVGGWCRMRTTK